MEIVPLSEMHIEDAAGLFAAAYRRQRASTPDLPPRHEDPRLIAPKLQKILERNPGVAAVEKGRLVGYMAGFRPDHFFGEHDGACCPEWAHGVSGENRGHIYEEMYRVLSGVWVGEGRYNHAVILPAGDAEVLRTFSWLTFGVRCVDAVRPLKPIPFEDCSGVKIKQATEGDLAGLLPLSEELQRFLFRPPIFLPQFQLDDQGSLTEWMSQPKHALWMAYREAQAVSFVCAEPSSPGASYIISDGEATASITGAYTVPAERGRGIAKALLSTAVDWAIDQGFKRMAVDFESANLSGRPFWLSHFQPVCYSLTRNVDDRLPRAANR